MKVKAYAARTGLMSLRILNASVLVSFKHTDDGWDASRESPPVPPSLPSTPRPSWQAYPDANASRISWAFRKYEKQLSARRAGTPLVFEPLDVPAPSERVVPEVTHTVQYRTTPTRLPLPRPDDEILSGYDKDVSSIRGVLRGEHPIGTQHWNATW